MESRAWWTNAEDCGKTKRILKIVEEAASRSAFRISMTGIRSTVMAPTRRRWSRLGSGVHAAYEEAMVSANRDKILNGLSTTPKIKAAELIQTGIEAAKATVTMMQTVFQRIPPGEIVKFYIDSDAKPKFSARVAGDGDQTIPVEALSADAEQGDENLPRQ